MSLNPPPGQFRPAQPRPRMAAARKVAAKLPPWGWLEWFVVLQTFIPAILFVPGMSRLRVFTRVAAYAIALVAWVLARASSQRPKRISATMRTADS